MVVLLGLSTYGHFAVVITILRWFFCPGDHYLVRPALDVVFKAGFYPHSLVDAPKTTANCRVLEGRAPERASDPHQSVATAIEK